MLLGWPPAECCSSFTPPSTMAALCALRESGALSGSSLTLSSGDLSIGVDSPVSADSLTVTEPWRSTTSAGHAASTSAAWPLYVYDAAACHIKLRAGELSESKGGHR